MKRLTITLFILATLLLNMLPACDGLDDHYSTNPTYRLSFSTDTLAFDTIFSTIGSTTRQFMIYNKNSEPLGIESIMLASGESTGFRMNVNGRKVSSFNNVRDTLANDSMYVFMEVTVDPEWGQSTSVDTGFRTFHREMASVNPYYWKPMGRMLIFTKAVLRLQKILSSRPIVLI